MQLWIGWARKAIARNRRNENSTFRRFFHIRHFRYRDEEVTTNKTEFGPLVLFTFPASSHVFGCDEAAAVATATVNAWRILFTRSQNWVRKFRETFRRHHLCVDLVHGNVENQLFRFWRLFAIHTIRQWRTNGVRRTNLQTMFFREIRKSFLFVFFFSVWLRISWATVLTASLHTHYAFYENRWPMRQHPPGNRHTQLPINFLTFLLAKVFAVFTNSRNVRGASNGSELNENFILSAMAAIKRFKKKKIRINVSYQFSI